MDIPRDPRIAVLDAHDLTGCYFHLADLLDRFPLTEDEKASPAYQGYSGLNDARSGEGGPGGSYYDADWPRRCLVADKASDMIWQSLQLGSLIAWFHDGMSEKAASPSAFIGASDKRTVAAGRLITQERPEPYLAGRELWIKRDNWTRYLRAVVAEHEGALVRRRGRRKGSGGYASADAPIVAKMIEGITSGRFATAYGAGMHHAGEAAGTGSLEAKARRLASRIAPENKSPPELN